MKLNGFYNRNTYDMYLYRLDVLSLQIAKISPIFDSSIRWIHNNIVTDTIYRLEDVKNSAREMMGYLECLWDVDLITDQTWTDLTEFYLFLYLECENYIDSLCLGDEVEFLMENRLRLCNHVKIELSYSNNAFRLDITVIDYKHGELPDWNLIRECAKVLDRYTLPSDDFSTAILTYNGFYAGMVIIRKNRTVLWYGKNTRKGKEIWNI